MDCEYYKTETDLPNLVSIYNEPEPIVIQPVSQIVKEEISALDHVDYQELVLDQENVPVEIKPVPKVETITVSVEFEDGSMKFEDESMKFEDPVKFEDESVKFEDEPVKFEDESVKFEDKSVKFEDESVMFGDESVKFEDTVSDEKIFRSYVKLERYDSENIVTFVGTHDGTDTSADIWTDIELPRNEIKKKPKASKSRTKSSKNKETFCHHCQKDLRTHKAWKNHEHYHDPKRLCVCQVCGFRFSQLASVKIHMKKHVSESSFPCGLCGRSFDNENLLIKHGSTHKPRKKRYNPNQRTCKVCGTKVAKSKFMYHVCKLQKKSRECPKCHKKYAEKYFVSHSCRLTIRSYSCKLCGKKYKKNLSLKRHMKLHEIAHFCHVCGEGFPTGHYLGAHLFRRHRNEPCYECMLCEKKFVIKKAWQIHQKKHSEEKPYPCNFCNTRFAQKAVMDNHMRRAHSQHYE